MNQGDGSIGFRCLGRAWGLFEVNFLLPASVIATNPGLTLNTSYNLRTLLNIQ